MDGRTLIQTAARLNLRLRLAGARTADAPDISVTHAVLPPAAAADGSAARVRAALSSARVADAAAGGDGGAHSAWLVGESWLDACEDAGRKVDESAHALKEGASV